MVTHHSPEEGALFFARSAMPGPAYALSADDVSGAHSILWLMRNTCPSG